MIHVPSHTENEGETGRNCTNQSIFSIRIIGSQCYLPKYLASIGSNHNILGRGNKYSTPTVKQVTIKAKYT